MLFDGNQTIFSVMQQGSQMTQCNMLNLSMLRQCIALIWPQL